MMGLQTFIKSITHSWPILLIGLLSLITLTPLVILAYVGLVVLVALLLPIKNTNLLLRLILSYGLLYSLIALIGALFWLCNIPQALHFALPIAALVLGAGFLFKGRVIIAPVRIDVISLVVGLATVFLVISPFVHNKTFGTLLQLFAYQGDNISHIELVNANVTKQGYVYMGLEDIRPYAYQTLSGYPQAWHLNIAIIQNSIDKLIPVNELAYRQVFIFYAMSAAHFAMLAVLTCIAIRHIVGLSTKLLNKKQTIVAGLVAALVTLGLFFGSFTTLFAYGFQTHIAALLLLLIVFFFLAFQVKNTSALPAADTRNFIWACICFVGLTMTWQVIAVPAAFGLMAAFFSLRIIPLSVAAYRKAIPLLVLFFVLGLASLFQFYILHRFGNDATDIFQPGLSPEPTDAMMLLVVGLVAVSLFFYGSLLKHVSLSLLLWLWGSAAVFSLILYIILEVSVGVQLYYYFKAAFTVILLGIVLIAPLFIVPLTNLAKKIRPLPFIGLLAALLLVGGSCIALFSSKEALSFSERNLAGIEGNLANAVASYMWQPLTTRPKIYALGSCVPDQDFKVTRLSQALMSDPSLKLIKLATPFEDKPFYLSVIGVYLNTDPDRPTLVISGDHVVAEKIRQEFTGNQHLILLDIDTEKKIKDITNCPNFIEYQK